MIDCCYNRINLHNLPEEGQVDSEKIGSASEHLQLLERLIDICSRLSAMPDQETFLQSIIKAAAELTGCELASILELDEGGGSLHFLALPWGHRDALNPIRIPLQDSIAGWVFQNEKPAKIPDVSAEPRHFKGADLAAGFTTRTLMAVPIIYQGEKLGVLEAVNKEGPAHYTEEDLIVLETLASQAAVAIQNWRLQGRVQLAQDQISQLDRMKNDFIAIASHELRTPLGLILGHATYLREVIQPELRPQVDTIVQSAMRLKEIIESTARMDNAQRGLASLNPHPVAIRQLIEEVLVNFQKEAQEKKVSLRADLGEDELLVDGDPSKIGIALSNLVKNAITFTDPGGHVVILAIPTPGYVKVSVIDDGIGIPPGDLPRIFERFYQSESHLTRKHGGMGLGLSVARVLIEIHGGHIWVESEQGKGSNFTFMLPVNADQAGAASHVPTS